MKTEESISSNGFPMNFARAATALAQSRISMERASSELRIAATILEGIDLSEVPQLNDPERRGDCLEGLVTAICMLDASRRELDEAWPHRSTEAIDRVILEGRGIGPYEGVDGVGAR